MGLIILLLGACVLHAMIASLPGFLISFFKDIEKQKKWLFLFFAIVIALFFAIRFPKDSINAVVFQILCDIISTYIGLLFLIALKNIAKRAGFCKICDKFKEKIQIKFRGKSENFNNN